MIRKALIFLCAMLCCFASGCAKYSSEYTPPVLQSMKNSRVFEGEYDKIWKATVDAMAKSFWTLSNIEKDSGILSFFFVTDDPRKGVDCGVIKVELEQFGKYAGTIQQNVATSYYEYDTHDGKHHNVVKKTHELRCDCNIIVNKISEKETMVSVNTLYNIVLNKEDMIVYNDAVGKHTFKITPIRMSFSGGMCGKSGVVTCTPTNDFENAILSSIEQEIKAR